MPTCRRFEAHCIRRAKLLDRAKAGNSNAIRMAIIAITVRSSTSVNAFRFKAKSFPSKGGTYFLFWSVQMQTGRSDPFQSAIAILIDYNAARSPRALLGDLTLPKEQHACYAR